MEDNKFKEVAMNPDNVDWDKMIERKTELYSRKVTYVQNMREIIHVYYIH